MNPSIPFAFLLVLATCCAGAASATPRLTPAGRECLQPEAIKSLMRKVADYQLDHLPPKPDNDWVRSALFIGILAAQYATGDLKYRDAAVRWGNEQGNWTPCRDRRHADTLCCGQTYCELYLQLRDPAMITPFREAVDRMMATPKRGREDWWWCDSLFMAPPAFARLAVVTGDRRYRDFMHEMWWDCTDYLYDPSESLYFRDDGYFEKKTKNGRKTFWSRGNGWVMAGTVRVLQYLPAEDPMRPKYIRLHQQMAARIVQLQGKDGLWRSSLLDPEETPLPETSGTGFYCYALAWGVNNGTLDRGKYGPAVRKAWRGLVGAVSEQGRLGWVQQIAAAPGDVKPDATQEYAVGAFLLAGSEVLKMETGARPEKPVTLPPPASPPDGWSKAAASPDPIALYVERFKATPLDRKWKPTGLSRSDYLSLIAANVDFWRGHQNADGAIIDPYRKSEVQYATPAFALAAAALATCGERGDLLEPAASAMDWACRSLSQRKAANAHEDFYPPLLAHALSLLKTKVPAERAARWEADLRSFDPAKTYRARPGAGNWNVVALAGEMRLHALGLRDSLGFVEDSLKAQGNLFSSPWGLYLEGPMAYDLFPRMWAMDALAAGYEGPYSKELAELLRRGALTSLFMQTPNGELPVGGRSAQHQWNEAAQCVVFEMAAADAMKAGDPRMAAAFKRAAHLALASMNRWKRTTGELQIVKNRADPASEHGYETYSSHSQYNLLAMAMLAIAYEHAGATEAVAEDAAPCDLGGYVLRLDALHKVIANAGGMYVEIDTGADPRYDATGLLAVRRSGYGLRLGTSQALAAERAYKPADAPKTAAAIGAAWQGVNGTWRSLAEYAGDRLTGVALLDVQEAPDRVSFQLVYNGYFSGPAFVSERYVITPEAVRLTVELPGYDGPMRLQWPMIATDGASEAVIKASGDGIISSLDDRIAWRCANPVTYRVDETRYPCRNGWAVLGIAESPRASSLTLTIEPGRDPL
jgi:rhamnogalacturonyl hydrolase YesR